jgi:hypothetical protein
MNALDSLSGIVEMDVHCRIAWRGQSFCDCCFFFPLNGSSPNKSETPGLGWGRHGIWD